MPYDIVLDELLTGFSVSAARKGEKVRVQVRGFASSEDGMKLVTWLEGLVSPYLARLSPSPRPSLVDNFVAVVRADRRARVYVNEVNPDA